MKTFFIVVSIILGVMLVTGALILFTPLRALLPQDVKTRVDRIVPDFFAASRSGIPQGINDFPDTEGNGTNQSPVVGWNIPGQNGSVITVNPFDESSRSGGVSTTSPSGGSSSQPNETPSGSGTSTSSSPPSGNITLARQNQYGPYAIEYFGNDQSFTVVLFAEPLAETRKKAEAKLLELLGITESKACYLRYTVATPIWVNGFYGGINLGFSFCPGATKL